MYKRLFLPRWILDRLFKNELPEGPHADMMIFKMFVFFQMTRTSAKMSSRFSGTTRFSSPTPQRCFSNWIVEVDVYFIDKSSDIDLFYSLL